MPRSATDATRFTSTTPHDVGKRLPASSSSPRSTQQSKPGPTGETPQEKVRRLRAAADRARDAQISTFDKAIVKGRVWADRAHRFTTLSLIMATFVAGGVTVYAVGDMMIHNRRKRREFFQEQKALQESALANARRKIQEGIATEEDIKFIAMDDEYRAKAEADAKAKAEKKGMFRKSRDWLFSGLKTGEEGTENVEKTLESEVVRIKESYVGAGEDRTYTITDKATGAFEKEKERQRLGGPLDQLGTATSIDEQESPKAGGWTSWMTRR